MYRTFAKMCLRVCELKTPAVFPLAKWVLEKCFLICDRPTCGPATTLFAIQEGEKIFPHLFNEGGNRRQSPDTCLHRRGWKRVQPQGGGRSTATTRKFREQVDMIAKEAFSSKENFLSRMSKFIMLLALESFFQAELECKSVPKLGCIPRYLSADMYRVIGDRVCKT